MDSLAKTNRSRIFDVLSEGLLFVRGGESTCVYDTDADEVFQQEATFIFVTDFHEPDCFAVLDCYDKKYHLFVPHLPAEYAVWLGEIESLESIQKRTGCDYIHYTEELPTFWKEMPESKRLLITNKFSKGSVGEVPSSFTMTEDADKTIHELRMFKTPEEEGRILESCRILGECFRETIKFATPGRYEYQVDARLRYEGMMRGSRFVSFAAIPATGKSAATLHYIHCKKQLKDGDMFLLDAGVMYKGYASDVTRSFPVNGKFTEKQKELYQVVLDSQMACIEMLKPGVEWRDVHAKSLEMLTKGLLKVGILKSEFSLEEHLKNHTATWFQGHGIGHSMGLAVHDIGAFPEGRGRFSEPGYSSLRMNRILEPGIVVTIEPGCYFVDVVLNDVKKTPEKVKYVNFDKVAEYSAEIGGIRIEDDIIITKDGYKMLTNIPKTVEELEALKSE
ncbi:Xaa-Pro dipeptidase [Aduncisulcus paluster]|uniref:Xaa-Pro dipeptidase n=1 Tax=Aduncisulcus paluster TaxID=2918883 RepID=A0ABQ5K4L1_9EUKA|nr:Xaa-Pro dipeptidase [Aduncisulcus paluster]|eukprot:gnl/Carplike_NY0171/520_a716_3666.p1 GENE.gnl/Carplike_NY0171/520_a716_3666~~gnl/Carplike_NY0171/520_a716_3666.p1  ORF type:complete len:448 (-),score=148.22 gnl/Carplike_NY0171/520_a716_3666:36-1379(-)